MGRKATPIGNPSVLYVIYNTFATSLLADRRFVCILHYFMHSLSVLYVFYNAFATSNLADLRFACILQYFDCMCVLYAIYNTFATRAQTELRCGCLLHYFAELVHAARVKIFALLVFH